MSKPRPIHNLHREIRTQPDPAEPSFSYERESFLAVTLDREEQVADEFDRKLANNIHNNNNNNSSNNNNNNNNNNHRSSNNYSTGSNNSGSYGRGNNNSTNGNNRGSISGSGSIFTPNTIDTEKHGNISKKQSLLALALEESNLATNGNDSKGRKQHQHHQQPQHHYQQQQHQHQPHTIQQQQLAKKKKDIDKQRNAERLRKTMDLENDPNGFGAGEYLDDYDDDDDHAGGIGNTNEQDRTTQSTILPVPTTINVVSSIGTRQHYPFPSSVMETNASNDNNNNNGLSSSSLTGSGTFPPKTIGVPINTSEGSHVTFHSTSFGHGVSGPQPHSSMYASASTGSNGILLQPPSSYPAYPGTSGLDRSSSDQSTGSFLYCKTPNSAGLFGKSSSLIFPTGVDSSSSAVNPRNSNNNNSTMDDETTEEATKMKRAKIAMAIDQCENIRFPFKKKLILSNLKIRASDIPLQQFCNTPLGNSLSKLDLSCNNRLGTIPPKLVQNLPALKTLDLSQCSLNSLPDKWHLPKLTRLDLSNNRLDFPEESMLEGLPELQELKMYGNIVKVITVPTNPKVLSKLEILDLGYNDLVFLPPDLDRIKSLRVLKVMNNFLDKVPMRICEMDLKSIDVSSNPITEPPIETCERGICSMRRYWHCIRLEEQTKTKAVRNQTKQLAVSSSTVGSAAPSTTNDSTKLRRFINPMKKAQKQTQQQHPPTLPGPSPAGPRRSVSNVSSTTGSTDNQTTNNAPIVSTSTTTSTQTGAERMTGSAPFALTYSSNTSRQQSQNARQISVSSNSSSSFGSVQSPAKPKSKISTVEPVAEMSTSGNNSQVSDPMITAESAVSGPFTNYPEQDGLTKTMLHEQASDEITYSVADGSSLLLPEDIQHDQVTVNDTLKVIFVGMAMVGKTSMIRRLIEGENAQIPTDDERTVGVDIYAWEPKLDKRFEHIDSRIQFQDKGLAESCGDVDIKFSVWDFAGQHVYHATHELFFSNRALYVLVWDMGATNVDTLRRKSTTGIFTETGAFKLSYESSSDEEDEDDEAKNIDLDVTIAVEREARRADRALERDIDDKVQFWVDCIQSSAPGAAILPVASFDDYFDERMGGEAEAIRRCNMLKQRLLKHEERRINGIEERLQELRDQNRANDPAAIRLRKLLCSYTRPKLIFDDDEQHSVVRVSGLKYSGFDHLTEKIINIATGRDKGQWTYPIFHGHVGARIPRMRLDVRDAVREMRDRFKVVEWGYFVNRLRDQGLTAVEDISDALHFLTNTGEVSFFGSVMQGSSSSQPDNPVNTNEKNSDEASVEDGKESSACTIPVHDDNQMAAEHSDDDNDDERATLSMDDTSITAPSTADGSLTTVDDFMSAGLSQFVFLNPRWLVAAVACILRHDLDREIKETRRIAAAGGDRLLSRTASFFDAQLNCPVITATDAQLLWRANRITKKAADRAERFSNDMTMTPFEFLQRLLIRFGVFVPIDLSIEKATFGGKDYQLATNIESTLPDGLEPVTPSEITLHLEPTEQDTSNAEHFFLPSLLGPWEPSDAWTYKNTDSWKTTICHSVLFPDGVPPGLMERLTASVLSSIYAVANRQDNLTSDITPASIEAAATCEGRLSVKEVLCWRTAFYMKIGSQVSASNGVRIESIVEIYVQLANRESHLCVGSDYMEVGARRLILSGRGQEGDGGRKIWKGGYLLVVKCINRVMQAYGGLEYEMQGFCPECLAKVPVSKASSWELTRIRQAVTNGERTLLCKHHGHPVDTRLLAGPRQYTETLRTVEPAPTESANVAVRDLQHAVVVVGLWDGKERKVSRVGSGFLVDRKRGLIVTAAHTLINIWGDPKYQYGENYYGLSQGKVVIGVIPEGDDSQGAVFRYFAKIVSRCKHLDSGSCRVDACVLRITTRMETDVAGDGSGCGDVPEILLLNNPRALKNERLQSLKMTSKCELEEQVRVLGYNQGGEGFVNPGEVLNRFIDLSRGYVSKKFVHDDGKKRERFQPREEIVVSDCRTIGGHSGGPCVNQQGEVIGILSRADVADNQRCYLVPASELETLVRQAKKQM